MVSHRFKIIKPSQSRSFVRNYLQQINLNLYHFNVDRDKDLLTLFTFFQITLKELVKILLKSPTISPKATPRKKI